jgi:hypothetical protein
MELLENTTGLRDRYTKVHRIFWRSTRRKWKKLKDTKVHQTIPIYAGIFSGLHEEKGLLKIVLHILKY